jgi:uncharacterized protein
VTGSSGALHLSRHLPRQVPIDGYGKGGFAFADMSHRGSLLCLPSGLWAWPVTTASDIDEITLAPVFAEAADIGLFLIGYGDDVWSMPDALRKRFRELNITLEVTRTGTAVSTYNILLEEGRRAAAGFVTVE